MEENNAMLRDRLKSVAKMINGDNLNILNIGFGSGNLEKIYFAKKKNFNWRAIDISQHSVKRALKKYPKEKLEKGNIKNIKNKENKLMIFVLSPIANFPFGYFFKALLT